MAELIEVEARNLFPGDIIGEGQRLHASGHDFATGVVTAHWGPPQTFDEAHRLTFHYLDIVRVVRSEPWLSAWPRFSNFGRNF